MTSSSPHVLWNQAVSRTHGRSPATFEQWFSGVQFDGLGEGVLALTARDEFVRDWVREHFLPDLLSFLEAELGQSLRVDWTIDCTLTNPIVAARPQAIEGPKPVENGDAPPSSERRRPPSRPNLDRPGPDRLGPDRPGLDRLGPDRLAFDRPATLRQQARSRLLSILNPNHTFENFVVGPSNELAYAAAVASAGGGGPRYNPLFIAGGTGLGKTHLVHAIAHSVLRSQPEARVIYVSAEYFTNEFIQALQHHKMEEFRARYRGQCDLLLLDDIQFLAGREQTQEEFFHTFNALIDAGKAIIVTSDKYPQQLQRMPERLVSRFTSGLVADVQVPQLETRVAIVHKKAVLEGIQISDDIAVLLAQNVRSNVRELEGALIRLAAKASLMGRPIDLPFTQSELSNGAPRRERVITVEDIQRAVCGHFRLTNAELLSKDRHKSVAFARQVAMYLCRQRLKCSFPELGRAFGNRDHTTVISAVRRVASLVETDSQVSAHLEAIARRLALIDD